MKKIVIALVTMTSTIAFADTRPTASTLVQNRKTGETLVISCDGENFDRCENFKIYLGSKSSAGEAQLKELKTISRASLEAAYDEAKRTMKSNRPSVLPELDAPFEQMYSDVPGYFFNITQGMWSVIDDSSDGSPSSVAMAVGGGIVTPVTGAVDVAGTTVIDSALIVSYPVRAAIQGIAGQDHKTFRAIRMLKKLRNGKEKSVSNKTFNALRSLLVS